MSAVEHGSIGDEELAALGDAAAGLVDLSANLHPDPPPAAVVEAFRAAAVDRYPSSDAAPLRAALAALHRVAPECVVVTPGASAAIYLAMAALVTPGDRCVVVPPTFGEYARAIEAAGGVVVEAPAAAPMFDVVPAPPSALAVLCNPNNPTGRHLHRTQVDAITARTGHFVIDAAYEPLAEAAWDAVDLVREGRPVVVVHSLTKLFSMPSIRLGYLVAPEAIAERLRRRQPPWPVGAPEIAAGCAALALHEERRRTVPALHERRRRLEAAFAGLGLRFAPSATNFLLVEVGDAPAFRARLLPRGFVVRDGTSFGLPGWVRVAVPAEAHLERLVGAFGAAHAERP